jgi:hypothetical protein
VTEPKKPWEEEWSYDSATWSLVHEPQEVTDARNTGRAKLASAAPDMARMLLTIQWGVDGFCWSCREDMTRKHKPDCEWVRVMRKAGVIE